MTTKAVPQASSQARMAPNQTLYCQNLNDKLNKNDLRRELYMLFSTYGTVLDIVALKTMKMRGQAHVVFRDVQASTQAMRALQGFEFFGKEMQITYAKGTSDRLAKLAGTFKVPQAEAEGTATTELQQSIFNQPPGSSKAPAPTVPAAPPADTTANGARSPQGTKRPREEESDGEDAPMEEEDDEGDAMEESDSD